MAPNLFSIYVKDVNAGDVKDLDVGGMDVCVEDLDAGGVDVCVEELDAGGVDVARGGASLGEGRRSGRDVEEGNKQMKR